MAAPAYQSSDQAIGALNATPTISSVAPDAGADRVAIFVACWEKGAGNAEDVASVTWNGQSFVKLGTQYSSAGPTGTHNAVSMWYLLDADFPGSTGDITLTMQDGVTVNTLWVAVLQATGAAQQAPDAMQGATTAGSSVTASITTSVDDCLLVEGGSNGNQPPATWTPRDGQTEREENSTGSIGAILLTNAAATAGTFNETLDHSSASRLTMAVTAIQPVAASAASFPFQRYYQMSGPTL